jgi:acyl-[acyl-carrier protein] desaturase
MGGGRYPKTPPLTSPLQPPIGAVGSVSDGVVVAVAIRRLVPHAMGERRVYLLVGRLGAMNDSTLLCELEPTVERLLERHLASSKEWFPHELVPYGRGRDDVADHEWHDEDSDLGGASIDDAVRSSLIVNLLTEDNLPYYFRSIERMFGADRAWGAWARRWTAEEGRHSMVIYGYLMVTRAVDPRALERARMAQVSGGITPEPATAADGFVYLALQELATRIAHRNTGRMIGDPAGYAVMKRVASDENLHHLVYRDLTAAAIQLAPSTMVKAVERQVVGFEMPGAGIPGFAQHAAAIAKAGVYDLAIHHDQILVPVVLHHWGLERLEGLDAPAEQARERLMERMAKSARVARRLNERRKEQAAALA